MTFMSIVFGCPSIGGSKVVQAGIVHNGLKMKNSAINNVGMIGCMINSKAKINVF